MKNRIWKKNLAFAQANAFHWNLVGFVNLITQNQQRRVLQFAHFLKDQAFAFFLVEEPKTINENEFERTEKTKNIRWKFNWKNKKFLNHNTENYRAYNGCFKTPCIRRTYLKTNLQKLTLNSKQKLRARSFWKLGYTLFDKKFTKYLPNCSVLLANSFS